MKKFTRKTIRYIIEVRKAVKDQRMRASAHHMDDSKKRKVKKTKKSYLR